MSEVRFIKKNGRIIPIRGKDNSNKEMSVKKALLTGVGLNVAGVGVGLGYAHADKKEMKIKDFMKKHGDMYKRAGKPDIFHSGAKGAFSLYNGGELSSRAGKILGVSQGIERPSIILGTSRSEATILHEMGHLEASRKKYSFNKSLRKFAIKNEQIFRKNKTGKLIARNMIFNQLRPFFNIPLEAEATGYAIRQAKRAGGFKSAFKVGAKLSIPFSSYGLVAGGSALTMYGTYKFFSNRAKKKE
jgi:hypothetical protein